MVNILVERRQLIWSKREISDDYQGEGNYLDLTFFDTGECQHVFTSTREEDAQWVYKVPAAFGYILPLSHASRKGFKPRNRAQQLMRLMLVSFPTSIYERAQTLSAKLDSGGGNVLLRVFDRCARLPKRCGDRLLASYILSERVRRFNRMLQAMELMREMGLGDIPLPYQIIYEGRAVLRVNDRRYIYEGPILVQRKADFFVKSRNFKSFLWEELVSQQQRLWKHGIALDAPVEILGPKNWALMDGRLHLGDTSGLTMDLNEALRAIKKARLDKKAETVVREAKAVNPADPAEEYFREVRKQINEEKLVQLWRSAIN